MYTVHNYIYIYICVRSGLVLAVVHRFEFALSAMGFLVLQHFIDLSLLANRFPI